MSMDQYCEYAAADLRDAADLLENAIRRAYQAAAEADVDHPFFGTAPSRDEARATAYAETAATLSEWRSQILHMASGFDPSCGETAAQSA